MAAPTVNATVTELPESRVRVDAEVPPAEVDKKLAQAARALARSIRVPGFRAGKAPPPVVIQRVGRQAVLDEAVRESIGGWYAAAIDAASIAPVGEPDLSLEDLPGEGQPLRFTIEIGVRPKAKLGEYKGLEVPGLDPDVSDEAIWGEIDEIRERSAKLETVDRPAGRGDFVVMDFVGSIDGTPFGGGEGRDQMVELGSGRLVPGFEEEIKAKDRPALDDDLAAEAGFDTLEELREDIKSRIAEQEGSRIEAEFREAALIEPTEEDLLEAVGDAAEGGGSPKKLLERLKSSGRIDALKEDLAQRRALDLIAESAKPITTGQAEAREKLWTPGSS